ncbi:MAG: HD domain-containing protein [Patescibacteria group bacterium]|nr:HD domain-containing protein [Patescibacteria group bacterium]
MKRSLVHIVFEAAVVKRLQRTGWQILGGHAEGVGEHSFMTAVIAYFLCKMTKANLETVLIMSIFHDFHEARTGEIDKLAKFYITRHEDRANRDIFESVDPELLKILQIYEEKKTLEARIVYEANILAFLVELKLLTERGHTQTQEWFDGNAKRLRLKESKELAEQIRTTDSQEWWTSIRKTLHEQFLQE